VTAQIPLFSATVLPKYFTHTNASAFFRQLSLHGFEKVFPPEGYQPLPATHPASEHARQYRHPQFLRGRHDLLHVCVSVWLCVSSDGWRCDVAWVRAVLLRDAPVLVCVRVGMRGLAARIFASGHTLVTIAGVHLNVRCSCCDPVVPHHQHVCGACRASCS
jgi:hypothetical protein